MTLRDLQIRARALFRRRAVDHELDEELEFHIACETQKLVAAGVHPSDAVRQARARFGSRAAIADDCRDERGIGAIEILLRDLAYAWRMGRRAPLAALTIISTLTVGLSLATTAFSVFNAVFLRVDAVSHPDRLVTVRRPLTSGTWVPFTIADYDAIRRETTVFSGMAALTGPSDIRLEGRLARVRFVSGTFFSVLGAQPVHGRVLTPGDDRPGAAPLVLSGRGWARLFGADPAVIGRHVRVNGADAEVVGVMPDGFFGLAAVPPDFWGSLGAAAQMTPAGAAPGATAVEVIGRLKDDLSRTAALDSLRQWAAGPGLTQVGKRAASIALWPCTGLGPAAAEALPGFAPFFMAFGLVLLIGCANVANLLLARGVARQQEIGIRLSLGASPRRIARQLLTESLLLAAIAAALAFPAARLLMHATLAVVAAYAPPEMGEQLNAVVPSLDWHIVAFLAVAAVLVTALFGIAPAIHATRLSPVRTMRGEVIADTRPARVRHLLITGQVAASALLLITTVVLLRGAVAATAVDTGLRVQDTTIVSIANEARRTAILDAVAADPGVSMVSAASPPTAGRFTVARALATSVSKPVTYGFASRDFFDVIGIDIVRGRGFLASERSAGSGVVVVSAPAARRLWPGRDALGQAVRMQLEDAPPQTFTVVGVVRGVPNPNGLITGPAAEDVYVPGDLQTAGTQLAIRVRDDPFRARARLIARLTEVDPALGAVMTLRTMVSVMTFVMRALVGVGVLLGGLALLLTVSGLFSVLSYAVERRTREIGVRAALGASASNLVGLVIVESARPVAVGLAMGVMSAAALAGALMASPLASGIKTIVRVFDPVAYAASLFVIVMACACAASLPALRAVRIDPCVILRRD